MKSELGFEIAETANALRRYFDRRAQALGITGDRVRVMQPAVGGNFGRGLDLYPIDVVAALLARRARRPVKIEFERLEEFVASPTREPCVIRLRTAADAG